MAKPLLSFGTERGDAEWRECNGDEHELQRQHSRRRQLQRGGIQRQLEQHNQRDTHVDFTQWRCLHCQLITCNDKQSLNYELNRSVDLFRLRPSAIKIPTEQSSEEHQCYSQFRDRTRRHIAAGGWSTALLHLSFCCWFSLRPAHGDREQAIGTPAATRSSIISRVEVRIAGINWYGAEHP